MASAEPEAESDAATEHDSTRHKFHGSYSWSVAFRPEAVVLPGAPGSLPLADSKPTETETNDATIKGRLDSWTCRAHDRRTWLRSGRYVFKGYTI